MSTPDDKQVGLFVGWGARHAQAQLVELAELLNAPVATTLQGLAVFPADHPLHAGFGFSRSAVPAARTNCGWTRSWSRPVVRPTSRGSAWTRRV